MHPEVQALRDKIFQTKGDLARAETLRDARKAKLPADEPLTVTKDATDTRSMEATLLRVTYEVKVIADDITRLEAQHTQHEKMLQESFQTRQEYEGLTKELNDKEAELRKWQDEVEKADLALKEVNVQTVLDVFQKAQDLDRPSSPTFWRVAGLALVGGTAFGAGLVVLLNFLDRSVSTTEEASHYFGVPVHGVIGEIMTKKRRRRLRLERWLMWPVTYVTLFAALAVAGESMRLRVMSPTIYKESLEGKNPVDRAAYVFAEAREHAKSVANHLKR
jgi:hypothetical protein